MVPRGTTSLYASYANMPFTGGFPTPASRSIRTSFLQVQILFRPTRQWQLGLEAGAGIGLGFPSAPGSIRASASLGQGRRRVVRRLWEGVLLLGNMRD